MSFEKLNEEAAEKLFSKEKYPTSFETLRKAFISNNGREKETLEEETLSRIKFVLLANNNAQAIRILEQYAEFQKERSYSEEQVLELLHKRMGYTLGKDYKEYTTLKWFEKFKKK